MGYAQLTTDWIHVGTGGEASAYVNKTNLGQLTNGLLHCDEDITAVYRVAGDSEHSFLRNLAAAILDTAFVKSGKYAHKHIPSPIGLSEAAGLPPNGYLYEYAVGSDGFPWEFDSQPVYVPEWIQFSNAFAATGIPVIHDITDPDNARVSKNIIVQSFTISDLINGTLSPNWGRIDFGFSSCPVSWEKFGAYLTEHNKELKFLLGSMDDVLLLAYNAGMGQLEPKEVMKRYHEELRIFPIKFFNCL